MDTMHSSRVLWSDVHSGLESVKVAFDEFLNSRSDEMVTQIDELKNPPVWELDDLQLEFLFRSRATLRALTGYIAALSSQMKSEAVEASRSGLLTLEPVELAGLKERRFDDEKQEISDELHRQTLDHSFMLALKYCPRIFGKESAVDFQGKGWKKFERFCGGLRGMAHPATPDDLLLLDVLPILHPMAMWVLDKAIDTFVQCFEGYLPDLSRPQATLPDSSNPFESRKIFEKQHLRLIQQRLVRQQEFLAYSIRIMTAETLWALGQLASNDRRIGKCGKEQQGRLRNVIRTSFANVEGLMLQARFFLEGAARRREAPLAQEDRDRMRRGAIEDRIVGTLNLFSDRFGVGTRLEENGPEWKDLREARLLRDRLTHPKKPQHLDVGNAERLTAETTARLVANLLSTVQLDLEKLSTATP